ncbi:lipopolysaccharide heptosyltransferase I [Candidatus Photodesmus blepharus]|uniref:Lipopolysaccharide heptosyltransferase I n=1 Tax=Candidatus Photodesmus blepharonis TaxID=1179155 RepID=A0A084CNM2_9GAMM|nr:glycosyltransferase family 9 protein [Candidatus Photodesmus blepharus]KEY91401.1 lipopolysaccharide heptosyltransferase I [Candidatus Photodesmus blepharus]
MPLFTKAPTSICFLRLSSIGDVCHALAVVQATQEYWPETQIVWILGKVEAQLLDGLEKVELIIFDKSSGLNGMFNIWRKLKGRHFDALLHMQLSIRSSILTLGIKAKYKIGFSLQRAKECQWFFTNRRITDTKSQHVLDSFFSFIEYLGVPRSTPHWKLPIMAVDHDFASKIVNNIPTVIICPAASKDERNWLSERYAQFADYVIKRGYQVIICGSSTKREQDLAVKICKIMKNVPLNFVGKTNLKQLAALLSKSQLLLAPDSGPVHIATAQGTPVIGLYAHSDPKRTGPYNNIRNVVSVYRYFAEQQGICIDRMPWSTRVKGRFLMQQITLEAVIVVFNAMMQSRYYV